MRHGQAENNVKRILVGRHIESHLTEEGKTQVSDTAQYLKKLDISRIYVSPVIRTVETAKIVSNVLNLKYEIDERLYEIDLGKLAGNKYNDVLEKYGNLFLSFYMNDDSILKEKGVESFSSVKKRINDLLYDLSSNFKNENVLLITHLDPIKAALSAVLDIKPQMLYTLHMRNAALTIFKHQESTWSTSAINFMGPHRYMNE